MNRIELVTMLKDKEVTTIHSLLLMTMDGQCECGDVGKNKTLDQFPSPD